MTTSTSAVKTTFVARATEDRAKGKTVFLYGATEKAEGVPAGHKVKKGPAAYTPRTAQAECWAWLQEGNLKGTVATIKEAAKAAGHGGQIAALLRHAARRGGLVITA